ncbi:hypothetical protein L596_021400 [Steinernema carpocapsae]|uniref:Uncharacterized protein n=1 Tax=Steinernema carpocapsae TaxID=34508 RepID=A0A4U5MIL3_STECR|nr:hypothetical protein L596_021400 [Steinernema carpocapsae]
MAQRESSFEESCNSTLKSVISSSDLMRSPKVIASLSHWSENTAISREPFLMECSATIQRQKKPEIRIQFKS